MKSIHCSMFGWAAMVAALMLTACSTPQIVRRMDVPTQATVQSSLVNVKGAESGQNLVQVEPLWSFALDEDAYFSYRIDTAFPAEFRLFWENDGTVHPYDQRVMTVQGGPASMRLDLFYNLVKERPEVKKVASGKSLLKFTTNLRNEGRSLLMSSTNEVGSGLVGDGLPDMVSMEIQENSVFGIEDPLLLSRVYVNGTLYRLFLKIAPIE